MAMGAPVSDTGKLMKIGGQLVLERDEGGTWRLDCVRQFRDLVGHRVRVRGIRAGFDVLDVPLIGGISRC